ncbi:MAG: phosphate/phosphite/phosphonate ABC transporter substrate-binding protein [Okeania sp. SIO2H7]|nr:phosphate/phosphite/phosphonate ABC transporter substrate-binding protein [Okeania sp. SIO2H7]
MGDISSKPTQVIERFQPLATYLATNLSEYGITEGQVKVAPDLATMTEWLANGEVDLYFDSAYPALRVSQETGAVPILRRWKKGVGEYHSVFFTSSQLEIQDLRDLRGHVVAFDSPHSTSGYMLPIVTLLEAGLNPDQKESVDAVVNDDEVGYVFSDDDDNTLLWVLEDEVSAGVVDSETFSKLTPEGQHNIRVLFETESIPRHVAVVAADLQPAMVDTLKTVMIEMDDSAEGTKVLQEFEQTAKFDDFPDPSVLERLEELFQQADQFQ